MITIKKGAIMVYEAEKATHPGKMIQRELDFLGVNQNWLVQRTGSSKKLVSQIINGEALITPDFAMKLENVFGTSSSFWLNLSSNYQATKIRIENAERANTESEVYMNDLGYYNELVHAGYVEPARNRAEKVIYLWRFFGVNSLDQIEKTQSIAFRKTKKENFDKYAVAAWLRCGEIEKDKYFSSMPEFDPAKLKQSIADIKRVIYKLDNNFFEELQKILRECGVALVAVKYFKRTYVNGASRWIGRNPVIELSDRGKRDDIIWFTLFHEIGHLLLHGKRMQFIDYESPELRDEEKEADSFATESLLATKTFQDFIYKHGNNISKIDIRQLASSNNVPASVILGRLQHEKILDYSTYTDLTKKIILLPNN